MLLTEQERLRFIQWLETNAESAKLVAEKLRKLETLGSVGEVLAKREERFAEAALLVIVKLRVIETGDKVEYWKGKVK